MFLLSVAWQLTLKFLVNMIPLLSDKMNTNKFVKCFPPTKRQIFQRTGSMSGVGTYSNDDAVVFAQSKTQSAYQLLKDVDSYVPPKNDE